MLTNLGKSRYGRLMADIAADTREGWEPAAIPTETIHQRIRYIRLMLDETVSGMGKLVGVPGQTWGTWEDETVPRKLHEVVERIVAATHSRFAPEAPASAMRDWLIWGPMSRWIAVHAGQTTLFPDLLVAA